jgi:hypothetical protein
MKRSKPAEQLVLIYVAGWLAVVLVQHLRAHTQHDGLLTIWYGVAPNFIVGFCEPSIFLLYRRHARRWFPALSDLSWFCLSVALGIAAGVAWEFLQPGLSRLVFDPGDVIATVLGGLVFAGCWPLVRKNIAAA